MVSLSYEQIMEAIVKSDLGLEDACKAAARLAIERREALIMQALVDAGIPPPDPSWPRAQIKAHLRLHMTRPVSVMIDGTLHVISP